MALFDDLTKKAAKFTEKTIEKSSELVDTAKTKVSIKSAKAFVKEMLTSGLVDEIKKEKGNRRYEYFFSVEDEETVLLVDSWDNQEAIDLHHSSSIMDQIMELRIKYHLHMKVERYFLDETGIPKEDQKFIQK